MDRRSGGIAGTANVSKSAPWAGKARWCCVRKGVSGSVKLITKEEAAALVQDGMTVGVGGFGAYGAPESLLQALADRFDATGHPAGLTVTCTVSPGNNTYENEGLNRIAKDGLINTIIAGHLANPPMIAEMVAENRLAAYTLPLGVVVHLYDAIAGHKPAVLTKVGLGTYADPRKEGCKANTKTEAQNRDIVELVHLTEGDFLLYKTFPIQLCFIRATCADEKGNVSMEEEAVGDFSLNMAAAVHNSGGIVVVEAGKIVKTGTIPPKKVRVHASIVDYAVIADGSKYRQGYAAANRGELSGSFQIPVAALEPMKMSNRKIIARRGAMELVPNCLINLGIGMPSGIGSVANEEGISATLSLESGPQGGVPVEGLGFGASVNPEVIYNLSDIFHLYDGGVLSMTFLGAAEIDGHGNVNVSKFGSRCTGPGGFINISQNTPRVHFIGTFTTGGLRETVENGKLIILQEGQQRKFCKKIQQITFSGDYAASTGQQVMYITERAVFRLDGHELLLTEIAPGIDLQKDILDQMEFRPKIADNLRLMDSRIFLDKKMNLVLPGEQAQEE